MRKYFSISVLCGAALLVSGCVSTVAGAAVDVATLPVKVVSKGFDLATTSQSEADEKRGKELRKRLEKLGKLERKLEEEREDCADGDRDACKKAQEIYDEIRELAPYIPANPD